MTLSLAEEEVGKVLAHMAKLAGARLVVSEEAGASIEEARITLEVKRIALRHVLEILLCPLGLSATMAEGALTITRREE